MLIVPDWHFEHLNSAQDKRNSMTCCERQMPDNEYQRPKEVVIPANNVIQFIYIDV